MFKSLHLLIFFSFLVYLKGVMMCHILKLFQRMMLTNFQAEFDVLLKSIKCYDINKEIISNYSCKIKITREYPGGLLYLGFSFSQVEKMKAKFELFFKYGTIFRPYLIKFDLDVCELMKKDSELATNKIQTILMKILENEFPLLLKGCPYEVRF